MNEENIVQKIERMKYEIYVLEQQLRKEIHENIYKKYGSVQKMCQKFGFKPARIYRHLAESDREMQGRTVAMFKQLEIWPE